MPSMENRTFDELHDGDSAIWRYTVRDADLDLFTHVADRTDAPGIDAGRLGGAMVAAAVDNALPGPGSVCVGESLRFSGRILAGMNLCIRLAVRGKDAANGEVTLACIGDDDSGT